MTPFEWSTVGLGIVTAIGTPALVLLFRLTVRFTQMSDRIADLAEDKERVHQEMYRSMREDRAATDRRLRWLEENLWRGRGRT